MILRPHTTLVALAALAATLLAFAARAVTPAGKSPVKGTPAAVAPPAMGTSTSAPQAILDPATLVPPPPAASGVKLDIPLAWQLTKSRLAEKGPATTMTESYRETWTIEQRPDGAVHLVSPRARVAAFLPAGEMLKPGITPTVIIVADTDVARLVGIPVEPILVDGEELPRPSTPVTLKLVRSAKSGTDVSMAWSDDEHFAVHLDVDNATLF